MIGEPKSIDPLLWTESSEAMFVQRTPFYRIGRMALSSIDRRGYYHLVIGPDLVKEYKSKNRNR